MEHFTYEEQVNVTKELIRISKEFHTFNPFMYSFFYRLGKWRAEQDNAWKHGIESIIPN